MITLLLAWRYLKGTAYERNISTMVKICLIGIFIAVAALTVTISVMRGFEEAMFEKLQGINPHITIRNYGLEVDVPLVDQILTNSFPEIAAASPEESRQVIIEIPSANEQDQVMVMRGVDPTRIGKVIKLEEKIVAWSASHELPALLKNNNVLIGKKKAEQLGLVIGDQLTVLYAPDARKKRKISFKAAQATISGLFTTGIEEYDTSILFCNIDFLKQLFPQASYTEIGLRLKRGSDMHAVVKKLRRQLPEYDIVTWQDMYASLVAASTFERYVMFFILALMTLVASMNIISLMFMQITQKRADIAILRSMGATHTMIRRIFLCMGLIITLGATVAGELIGAIICHLLQRYPFIQLPDVYYTTHLPAVIEWQTFVMVFAVAMIVSLISIWYAVRQTKQINIAQVLRSEA